MPLTNFIGKSFTIFVEVILWLVLAGGVLAGLFSFRAGFIAGILGLIGSVVGALIIDIVVGGFYVVLLNIRESLAKIEAKTK
ncbi:hypothetical protein HP1_040 [Candidatus Termititenax spirochaetophilus]|uniref:Uncharacterized protein n=1 Tax=Candidatus Termititenax spirochaetophilus TaxID=2218522 RepID=A0A388T9N8_9BACT|nr:hypothetical protein HP1_040 [Candidatus Termititenax spirochaetophilus]